MVKLDKFQIPQFKRYQYSRSPIQEAIVEIKFASQNFNSTLPGKFSDKVKDRFPIQNDVELITLTIGSVPSSVKVDANRPAQVPKFQTWSADRGRLLQIGPGLLTANCVKYSSWDKFGDDFEFGLTSLSELEKLGEIERVGVRYINRFLLTGPEAAISEYFNFAVSLPQSLDNSMAFDTTFFKDAFQIPKIANFQLRVRFCTDTLRPGEDGLPLILDIDCFTTKMIANESLEKILSIVESAHEISEFTFESFLSEKARRLIGGLPK